MKAILHSGLAFLLMLTFASCGEPERARPVAFHPQVARTGGEFDEVGKVSLFQGESCASQIVFVFHRADAAPISMAAPFHVSKVLSDAAHNHKTVHVVGRWKQSKAPGCSYIEATQAELIQKSFW
jgi:hypothetical protein